MSATQLTAADILLTKEQEGYVDHAYYDAVGVKTIGFGTTAGAGVVEPIPDTCTVEQATEWLLEYMNRSVVPAILASGFKPNQNQLGALADLGYNTGSGVFEAGAAMGDALRSHNAARVSATFMEYVYAGGKILSDLVHRREADRSLFDRVPPAPPTHHYGWYMAGGERTAVERYDHWRARQTKRLHPHRAWLLIRKKQCAFYSRRLVIVAHRDKVDGKPSWMKYRRGWRHVELARRAQGKLVRPT